jgi:hypothetical protein
MNEQKSRQRKPVTDEDAEDLPQMDKSKLATDGEMKLGTDGGEKISHG